MMKLQGRPIVRDEHDAEHRMKRQSNPEAIYRSHEPWFLRGGSPVGQAL